MSVPDEVYPRRELTDGREVELPSGDRRVEPDHDHIELRELSGARDLER